MGNDKAHFGHIKLVVSDLEQCAAFYREACGLEEMGRADAEMNGRPGTEIMFTPTAPGGPMLALVAFADASTATASDVMLGFRTDDLESFCDRVTAAGGRVTQGSMTIPEHGVKAAYATDVEGNVLEILQLL